MAQHNVYRSRARKLPTILRKLVERAKPRPEGPRFRGETQRRRSKRRRCIDRASYEALRAILQGEIALSGAGRIADAKAIMGLIIGRCIPMAGWVATEHGLPLTLLEIRAPTRGSVGRPNPRSPDGRPGRPLSQPSPQNRRPTKGHYKERERNNRKDGKMSRDDSGSIYGGAFSCGDKVENGERRIK